MEIQNWEQRNSEHALFESQRELDSQRLQLLEANQWADQAQRERIHLCSELEMKSRLHQECYARSCQEIEDLKRDAAMKKKNEVTQQKLNEYSMQHDQESRTVSLLRDHLRRLQELLEFLEDSKIFYDPSPSSYDRASVPHQTLITSSSRKPSREVGMLRHTREDMSITGNVFDCQHARRDPDSLAILRIEGI